ncbi:MAG: RagB/SusD family nutrient uptake outer membrane protein [Prevotella sp.]|nr:RagB/SusD family nutrient uptake outer membrane protein [Prevotella sp.]
MKSIINKYHAVLLLVVAVLAFSGCSDEFLKDKKLYGSFNGGTIYENYTSADNRVAYLYEIMLPKSGGGFGTSNYYNLLLGAGQSNDFSKCTEEYGGLSHYNDPNYVLDNSNVDDWFQIEINNSPYHHIRECNDVIKGVENSKSLTEDEKHLLLGQAYFFRAWRYYLLVKMYGGVPIVEEVQSPVIGNTEGKDLVIPRSSTKECIDFIDKDLDKAAEYLPASWDDANFGRITAGCALALKGRVDLLYASPLFNRADDKTRWEQAYVTNKSAIDKLKEGGFGLAYADNPGVNASGWAKMFASSSCSDDKGVCEGVFVTLYNNLDPVEHLAIDSWNLWEHSIRPSNTCGGGGKNPTAEEVDLFPMIDGKKPGSSSVVYDKLKFWLNRDPRFYRTFAFPGERWQFSSNDLSNYGFVKTADGTSGKGILPYGISLSTGSDAYTTGSNYELWSYNWYDTDDHRSSNTKSGFAADCLGSKNSSVYVRKRSDDYGVNSPLYKYDATTSQGFRQSAAPYMEIRYAEVLLNFAESACGAGHYDEAVAALKQIRQRVGYTGDCGLDANLNSDRGKLFSAILYERQVELAYEGKRFDDCRRWMLFDGGTGQEKICPSWKLTGFGGNTCSYLGVTPLDGIKRHKIEIYAKTFLAEEKNNTIDGTQVTKVYDKLYDQRPAALQLNESITANEDEAGGVTYDNTRVGNLSQFYSTNFGRKDISLDGNADDINPTFNPLCYFFGFKKNCQQNNISLVQNIGWTDYWTGDNGTFDPLSDQPVNTYSK